jgi:hypothetical protein
MHSAVLELPAKCIHQPTRLDLAIVENYMLWPNDPIARERGFEAATAVSINERSHELTSEQLRFFLNFAVGCAPIKEIQEAAKAPFLRGFLAGIILRHVVFEVIVDPNSSKASMSWIIQHLSERIWPRERLRPQTIRNDLWSNFRCVSHFWAAYVEAGYSGIGREFPCRVDRLKEFLTMAEAFRLTGETTRTKRSPRPVLWPGETLRLPDDLDIPREAFRGRPS